MEDSRRFQYFRRDADELESWINEKLQTASDESYKDPTNLQAKIQKHQAFEAEVAAHSNAIVVLDNTGMEMIKTINSPLRKLQPTANLAVKSGLNQADGYILQYGCI